MNRIPTKEKFKKCNVGQWLQKQKGKIDDKIYKILFENIIVKNNLDKYFINKYKEKLTFYEWKNLLFDFCNE